MKVLLVLSLCLVGSLALPIDTWISNYAKLHPNDGKDNQECESDIELEDGVDAGPGLLNAVWNLNKRWPDNTLYYDLGDSYSSSEINQLNAGISDLIASTRVNGKTCINVIRSSSRSNYVDINKRNGCRATIGMSGGMQDMSLTSSCLNRHGTIMHEFLHAFGFHHEHKRADRDSYVYINYDNIDPDYTKNFDMLVEGSTVDHMGTRYDYGSVMHYGAYGFPIDPSIPTIIPHDPNAVIGQRTHLSAIDIERVQIFYCCLSARDSKYHRHLADSMRNYC